MPHQTTKTSILQNFPSFFPWYIDAVHRASSVALFSHYILVVNLNIPMLYILSLKISIYWQPSFGKWAGHLGFGAPHSARVFLFREGNSQQCLVLRVKLKIMNTVWRFSSQFSHRKPNFPCYYITRKGANFYLLLPLKCWQIWHCEHWLWLC